MRFLTGALFVFSLVACTASDTPSPVVSPLTGSPERVVFLVDQVGGFSAGEEGRVREAITTFARACPSTEFAVFAFDRWSNAILRHQGFTQNVDDLLAGAERAFEVPMFEVRIGSGTLHQNSVSGLHDAIRFVNDEVKGRSGTGAIVLVGVGLPGKGNTPLRAGADITSASRGGTAVRPPRRDLSFETLRGILQSTGTRFSAVEIMQAYGAADEAARDLAAATGGVFVPLEEPPRAPCTTSASSAE
jgi:hypothetical protein